MRIDITYQRSISVTQVKPAKKAVVRRMDKTRMTSEYETIPANLSPLPRRGVIFSLEGIDASGKKTQSLLLQKWLDSKGIRNEYISFPDYSTVVGQEIRAFLSGTKSYSIEARHMLYSINRLEHKDTIEKWLADGEVIVINRYCDSNLAYGAASGLSIEWLTSLESKMPAADYIFYLKADSQLSRERKSDRDKFEIDIDFLRRVTSVYNALAKTSNWFTIDADNSIESIRYEITRLVEKLLQEPNLSELKERPIRMKT
jgi:dTMP kinase